MNIEWMMVLLLTCLLLIVVIVLYNVLQDTRIMAKLLDENIKSSTRSLYEIKINTMNNVIETKRLVSELSKRIRK